MAVPVSIDGKSILTLYYSTLQKVHKSKDNVDCASLALQVAPVSYYCLIFFIGLRPKLGYTYYHIIETISLYGLKLNHVIKNPFYYVLSIGSL
jgi:hypothetical protein